MSVTVMDKKKTINVSAMMVFLATNVKLLIALDMAKKLKENVNALQDSKVKIVKRRNAMAMEKEKMENVSVILKNFKETIVMKKLVLETDIEN